jgi:hypothetical protein
MHRIPYRYLIAGYQTESANFNVFFFK